ncbi:hypothetical protein [Lentilactobacillus kisonensis]|uniref:Surface layer protein A domain-containing protein n=2 Tax=Lentilactobacillus kisonensis TaxID=481722 RepID=H1LG05_9LACO|nr:hypothetical protein [Lentilactobacillus kisonensis]EHO51211.1 hypothetical protein HMPREF9104_01531 [Lentilactobacillus kisonensis F0435]KRL20350.1 hypothetical protein FC98_GL001572 [Lentilactobacillus kisonensis DSM 19906 = JCM 15041]
MNNKLMITLGVSTLLFSSMGLFTQPASASTTTKIKVHNYKQAEQLVTHKFGHHINGRYYVWTAMGYGFPGHTHYLFRYHDHRVYWIRGVDYYAQKQVHVGTYWGHDYFVYQTGRIIKRPGGGVY